MNGETKPVLVLAGDVGGTKTNLALFACDEKGTRIRAEATFPSARALNLSALVARFVENHPAQVSAACFGIPGPVIRGRSRTTNLPWVVSEDELKARFGWSRVYLLNDLSASAHGVPTLDRRRFSALNRIRIKPDQPRSLLAPGTGLGVSIMIGRGDTLKVLPSEGGHVDFAPSDEDEVDLWRHLRSRFGHVSIERILSGPGLLNIYAWLRDSGRRSEPRWLARRLEQEDGPAAITRAALERDEPLCRETLLRFVSILGAAAGNVALTAMTTGGVYLGGGIPPKILPILKEGAFLETFANKGRFRPLVEKIGVRVIMDERTALKGAARFAFERLEAERRAPITTADERRR
ncbi:MAG: glucokinase [Deltaproteobacteria bacterium]|nr:glucokinase [Deltaproteobacteria bacterium]